jgi:hypothetical protein
MTHRKNSTLHLLKVPPVGSVVTVKGGHGRAVYTPWRGKVVAHDGKTCAAVLPLERGKGWSTEPVIVRLEILEAV